MTRVGSRQIEIPSEVKVTIEKILDNGLPEIYTPDLFEMKTAAVFQHVYKCYYGAGKSIYSTAA